MFKIENHTLTQLPPTTYPGTPLPIQITLRGQSHQKIRIPEHAPSVEPLVETARQTPPLNIVPHYRRLVGNIKPSSKPPTFADTKEDFIAASDGTVLEGKGGAAATIHSNTTRGILQTIIPVDCHRSHITSYRTELLGILATIILTHALLNQTGEKFTHITGTIYCDNKAAVNQYQHLSGTIPPSIRWDNANDADVLQELRHWKGKIPTGITIKWIKAHQAKPTSRPARLNHVVDRLAAE